MGKQKVPTPQELYWARKRREEEEKDALLPPGLINHGNTCFMNSVLQGLVATPLLSDLVAFQPLHQFDPEHPIVSWRSPELTNGHGIAGNFEKEWMQGMPLGDTFLAFVQQAWKAQDDKSRQNMSPREILTTLGNKYDQYLDFRQQDAHEFLRHLLDAMRMEELDIIKQRQTPPEATSSKSPPLPTPQENLSPLATFSDMLFGGRLASIVVCQRCHHVSWTSEDFSDLSLSIKPEDYTRERERRRDRLKKIAKKIRTLGSNKSSITPSTTAWPTSTEADTEVPEEPEHEGEHERKASSVPASPRESTEIIPDDFPFPTVDTRRRSEEAIIPISVSQDEHKTIESVEFADLPVPLRKKERGRDDGWSKLSKRISLGFRHRRPESTSRERTSSAMAIPVRSPQPSPGIDTPSRNMSSSRAEGRTLSPAASERSGILSPALSLRQESTVPARPKSSRGKSFKAPKLSAAETAFLKYLLADIHPTSSFNLFRPQDASAAGIAQYWLKLGGGLPSIEECLRMFTAVESLDGDNMVGCRRCWKIQNGLYHVDKDEDSGIMDSDTKSSDTESLEEGDEGDSPILHNRDPSRLSSSSSLSSLASVEQDMTPGFSASSLPTSLDSSILKPPPQPLPLDDIILTPKSHITTYAGLPIPSISTTAPESPGATPSSGVPKRISAASPMVSPIARDSLQLPAAMKAHEVTDNTDESSDGGESDSSYAVVPPGYSSPKDTPKNSQEKLQISASSAIRHLPSSAGPGIPREKRVVLSPAFKRYLVEIPPPILVIHLKRFQQNRRGPPTLSFTSPYQFKKLDDSVTFPEHLDLTPFLAPKRDESPRKHKKFIIPNESTLESKNEKCMYRLYAVVVHIGNMLGGHYIAYTALPSSPEDDLAAPPPVQSSSNTYSRPPRSAALADSKKRQWAYISDTVVRLASLEEVLKANAYLCMYERI